MITAWLDLPTFGIFITLSLLYVGSALTIWMIIFHTRLGTNIRSLKGLVAPFFSSVAILFGLLTGFLANDVGDRNRQAVRAVQAEAGELHNVYALSVASASDMKAIRIALKAYAASAVNDEWPAVIRGGLSSPLTEAAYDELLRKVSDPAITRDASGPVHVALLSAAVRAGTARTDRLSLAADRTNDLKWTSVLILGLITQIGLALVHLEQRRAMLTALTVFASGAIVALGLIALQEHPSTRASGRSHYVVFRRGCNYRLRQGLVDFADGSRQAIPWAQDVYARARARGHTHAHAVRVLARAWLHIIWRCWTDGTPYDPARHLAAVASRHSHTGTPEPTPMAFLTRAGSFPDSGGYSQRRERPTAPSRCHTCRRSLTCTCAGTTAAASRLCQDSPARRVIRVFEHLGWVNDIRWTGHAPRR